jgi:hypothetical protein
MNETQPWEFTCKTCGGHSLTVNHVWSILAGPDSESWQEWGPLEADHLWRYEFKEKVEQESDEEGEVERGDFGEFAEDDSDSEPEEYEIFEPEDDPESEEFYVNCAGCDREIEFGWSDPIGVGAYFLQNVQTSFRDNIGRNPGIGIPGSRSTGSELGMVSHEQV